MVAITNEKWRMKPLKTLKYMVGALQFLTRISLPGASLKDDDLARSMRYFPLVGIFIGAVLVVCNYVLTLFLPVRLVNLFLIGILVLLTGALHLDGFSDTIDGFMSSRSREKILSIMKDSRVGAFGVIGIVLLLIAKYELLNALCSYSKNYALIMMPLMGRWAMVLSSYALNYARSEKGTGKSFVESLTLADLIIASLWMLVAGVIFLQLQLFVCLFFVLLTVTLFLVVSYRKIGGITGDVIGFISEITELMVLFLFAAHILS